MSSLRAISRFDLIKRLRKLGWEGPRAGTNHGYMVKGTHKLRVPNPHSKDISVGLLKKVLSQADISRDEWLDDG